MAQQVAEVQQEDEDKGTQGLVVELMPLLLLLVAMAFVGFFAVLIIRLQEALWAVALVAAVCLGAGTVYFAVVTRSDRNKAGFFGDADTLEELRRVLAQDGEETDRHLEHLIQGLALGHLISLRSPNALGLPQDVRERVHDSIRRHARGQDVDPTSSTALWGWLMKEGLGELPGMQGVVAQDEGDGYLEYVMQGVLLGYLISRDSDGTLQLPQDMLDRILHLVKDRAVNDDDDPDSASSFWMWLLEKGTGVRSTRTPRNRTEGTRRMRREEVDEREQPRPPRIPSQSEEAPEQRPVGFERYDLKGH